MIKGWLCTQLLIVATHIQKNKSKKTHVILQSYENNNKKKGTALRDVTE